MVFPHLFTRPSRETDTREILVNARQVSILPQTPNVQCFLQDLNREEAWKTINEHTAPPVNYPLTTIIHVDTILSAILVVRVFEIIKRFRELCEICDRELTRATDNNVSPS